MIRKASEVNPNTRFRGLIYGLPGVRKSSTALSAPRPLVVDTDRGWERVEARFRTGSYIQPETYDELLSDLVPENVAEFDTIVFDTGGALLDLMKPYVIRQNPKNGQKDGATVSLAGYGALSREFSRLVDHCFKVLGKNVLMVFHAKEEQDGETKVFRLDVEGSTRSSIWKCMDFGGFMEMRGNDHIISFSPTERFYAKGTRGVSGEMKLPVPKGANDSTFIADIFTKFKVSNEAEIEMVKKYNETMEAARDIINAVDSIESAESAIESFKTLDHYFASKTESWNLLKQKAEKIGLTFNGKNFIVKEVK